MWSIMRKTLIVLAGGRSRRMGENKAFLKYNDKTFIEATLKKFEKYDERIIVTNEPSLYKYKGVKTVQDIYPDMGPVCGIYTGLLESSNSRCVVVTVDTPFLTLEMMDYLWSIGENVDAVIPTVRGRCHPLCGIYNKSAMNALKKAIDINQRRIIDVHEEMKIREVRDEELIRFGNLAKLFYNVNTPDDFKTGLEI